MPEPQSLFLLVSDSLHLAYAQEGASSASAEGYMLWKTMGTLVLLVVAILGFQFLNHRRKLKEMQLKTLENLARQGKIGREDIDKIFGSWPGLAKAVLVVSWIGFVVSIFLIVVSQLEYRWKDALMPAAFAAVFFFALLSTPFLLSEYRRTQEP